MTKYLHQNLIDFSFKRLAPQSTTGKKSLERTSALMYFLAIDGASKKLASRPLDLNPNTAEGKDNRQAVELEFVKLVKLKNTIDMRSRQVSVLGEIKLGAQPPEKRISSNFLTVPLKKASESSKEYEYPRRPAPILIMGTKATGVKWGADYHHDWQANLPKFLSEIKSNTPFTDLGIFVFRDSELPLNIGNINDALSYHVTNRFSPNLASFWSKRVEKEKMFFKYSDDLFSDIYPDSLAHYPCIGKTTSAAYYDFLSSADKEVLIERIIYLEETLNVNDIQVKSLVK